VKNKGSLFLIPNTLGGESVVDIIPQGVIERVNQIRTFAVEDVKSARRLLRKMDRSFPIDDSTFLLLSKQTKEAQLMEMLLILLKGEDIGIISEAGCPGIADPGAELVSLAHTQSLYVYPMVGPSIG
jgi:16S rRNA (cytidine1402-2'-O)-methyltransferase